LHVASRCIAGLPSGLYSYQPREHALALHKQPKPGADVDDFMRLSTGRLTVLPHALLIFTGSFQRVVAKYGAFGYRLINLDAGAAVSQLQVVLQSLGIRSRISAAWSDDAIERQLGFNSLDEQVTCVIELWEGDADGNEVVKATEERSGCPNSLKPVRAFHESSLSAILTLLYHESRIDGHRGTRGLYSVPPALNTNAPEETLCESLPPAQLSSLSVGAILHERRTTRRYSERPVSLSQLSTVLQYAFRRDVIDWQDEQEHGQALSLLVLATRVDGLASGAWMYKTRSHSLTPWRPALATEALSELFVQREFGAAPVHFYVLGNLAAVCARNGAWGHRVLLLRAGATAHRLWCGAAAVGLSGAIIAGLVPSAARSNLGLDGYRQAAVIGVASGFEMNERFSHD
jgi:SagB-type dehydrogenase family enzyme